MTTAAGAVPVKQPRVNDKRVQEATGVRARFSSAILPAWARKSPQVAEVLPLLYLHRLSSSDLFGPALEQFLGRITIVVHHPAGLDRRIDKSGLTILGTLLGRHPEDRCAPVPRKDDRPRAVANAAPLQTPFGSVADICGLGR